MIERLLTGSTPDEKIQEISACIGLLGLERNKALVRIFNSGLLENMRTFGTDRAGIEQIGTHPYLEDTTYGYREDLQKKGLSFEDGVFAVPFDHFGTRFPDLFENITLGISPHRIAIAVYRADMMVQINAEFCCFCDPSQKQQALAGVLLQPPFPIEGAFADLSSLEAKEHFLRERIDTLNRESIAIYLELAKDLVHLVRTKLTDAVTRAQDIFDTIERREIEMNVIDECWDQVALLRKNPNHPGINGKLVASRIRQRLRDGASTAGQAELLRILCTIDDSNLASGKDTISPCH